MPSGRPSSGRASPALQALVALGGLRQRLLGRRQHVGVEGGIAGLDRVQERLRQLRRGELLLAQPLARFGEGQLGEVSHDLSLLA